MAENEKGKADDKKPKVTGRVGRGLAGYVGAGAAIFLGTWGISSFKEHNATREYVRPVAPEDSFPATPEGIAQGMKNIGVPAEMQDALKDVWRMVSDKKEFEKLSAREEFKELAGAMKPGSGYVAFALENGVTDKGPQLILGSFHAGHEGYNNFTLCYQHADGVAMKYNLQNGEFVPEKMLRTTAAAGCEASSPDVVVRRTITPKGLER